MRRQGGTLPEFSKTTAGRSVMTKSSRPICKRAGVLLALALVAGIASPQAEALEWSSNYLALDHLWGGMNPGSPRLDDRTELNFAHADGWKYGSNFVDLILKQHTQSDPTNNAVGNFSHQGAGEFYGIFRDVLSGNKLTGTSHFSFGPVKDIGLEWGGDYGIHNDTFSSLKRMLLVGPQVAFNVPRGFWTLSIHAYHEWNTDAFYHLGGSDNFRTTWELETAWSVPVFGPVVFTGFANVIGPKGRGNSQDFEHRTEVLANPKLLIDIGHAEVGVGFQYWYHIFGTYNAAVGGGAIQRAWFAEFGYNLN